jgi:hypothetical protein
MSIPKAPIGAEAENIGKVVAIQVFPRKTSDPDTIDLESMEKHVGILESYYHDKNGFVFRLVGGERVFTSYKKQRVEIFNKEEQEQS